jgi:two-component system, chemotaxis family, sensor kinase CheA
VIDRDELLKEFVPESEELLATMEEGLLALERLPGDSDSLAAVFRAAHTLKGNAMVFGFSAVVEVAHAVEDLLDALRGKSVAVTPAVVTLLLSSLDALRGALARCLDGSPNPGDVEALLRELSAAAGHVATGHTREAMVEPLSLPADRESEAATLGTATLRVRLDRLDRLLSVTAEIATARLRLETLLEKLGPLGGEALDAHREASLLHTELQDLVLGARTVAVGGLFRQQQRNVRDLATATAKQVRLIVDGTDVEVDATLVEHIRDPLTHMVRNAVDHGIEAPSIRHAAGKDPTASIRLTARQDGGSVIISVADDGAGLDRARILAHATERGLVSDDAALSDADIRELIFRPGFSTAASVSETSGRGVGLDVVRRNVDRLHGVIRVDDSRGRGTTFTLRLPLTLAVQDGLRVAVGDETFLVPFDTVEECVNVDGMKDAGAGLLEVRGRPIPVLRLREVLGVDGATPSRENVVIVKTEDRQAGLAVDRVIGSGPAVVRPLGRFLRRVPGVAGSVVLGTGRIALVLDVPALLDRAVGGAAAAHRHG